MGRDVPPVKDTNPFTKDFDTIVKNLLDHYKVPGLSIGIIDGENIYSKGYGFATLPDTPATEETLWYVGSTTKAFVAATLSRMIASNQYPSLSKGWSTPMADILRDDFIVQDEWAAAHLTLDDAVSHRTGMAGYRHALPGIQVAKNVSISDVVRLMRYLPLVAEPRTRWIYSNVMYVTLAHVIETLTNKSLEVVVKELIWDPLDMKSTYLDLSKAVDAPMHLANGYYWDETTESHREVPFIPLDTISGAGGMISNINDYMKWVSCLINKSEPFSDTEHEDIQTPRMMMQPSAATSLYALGWILLKYKGHRIYTHGGAVHSYGAEVWWLPDLDFGIVAFGNTAGSSNEAEAELVWRLIDNKLGVVGDDRHPSYNQKTAPTEKSQISRVHNAVDTLFPDRPNAPLAPTLTTTDLQGIYHSKGLGSITLTEEPHPENHGVKILAAYRPEMLWRYHMKIHHVTGDYWIMYLGGMENPTLFPEYQACHFKIGADGNAIGFEVDWHDTLRGQPEGKVWFTKTA